jgi:hypothetical protein
MEPSGDGEAGLARGYLLDCMVAHAGLDAEEDEGAELGREQVYG